MDNSIEINAHVVNFISDSIKPNVMTTESEPTFAKFTILSDGKSFEGSVSTRRSGRDCSSVTIKLLAPSGNCSQSIRCNHYEINRTIRKEGDKFKWNNRDIIAKIYELMAFHTKHVELIKDHTDAINFRNALIADNNTNLIAVLGKDTGNKERIEKCPHIIRNVYDSGFVIASCDHLAAYKVHGVFTLEETQAMVKIVNELRGANEIL